MTVDKSKQTLASYVTVDVEVHCFCGEYIQNSDEINISVCPNCGQIWLVTVTAAELSDYDFRSYDTANGKQE